MKSPFRKVRGLGLHKRHRNDIQQSFVQLDELAQASQDMEDMRDCYDSLLSAAATTANNAYGNDVRVTVNFVLKPADPIGTRPHSKINLVQEHLKILNQFSESLQEMGGCLLEKTALSDDEDSGRVLLMLGKVQFEVQKQLDTYRSHINQTITIPSESLLNELRIVEEMKRQCDEKRTKYDALKIQYDTGRVKSNKGEHVSSRQLKLARDEFDEEATLFIFRMKSLKSGQSRSLLTQAARHYAAQMCFFRKALKSLEAIEPHVKLTTEQQHIDYNFSGLEDDDRDSVFLTDDEDNEDDSDDNYDTLEDSEFNIDRCSSVKKNEVSTTGKSMELDNEGVTFPHVAPVRSDKINMNEKPVWNSSTFTIDVNKGYKSAPLSLETSFDPNERYRQMRQSSTRKLNTYVLPTPLEKNSIAPTLETQNPQPKPPTNIWHSMPLQKLSGKPTPLPAPQTEVRPTAQMDPHSVSSAKKIKRYAFSGPLNGDSQSMKMPLYASGPIGSTPRHLPMSGSVLRTTFTQPLSTLEPSLSASVVSLPVISELHELPRPPAKVASKKPSKVGFSAPLVTFKGEPDIIDAKKLPVSEASYTLPVPSRNQSDAALTSKQTETLDLRKHKGMFSPPLSPITFRNV